MHSSCLPAGYLVFSSINLFRQQQQLIHTFSFKLIMLLCSEVDNKGTWHRLIHISCTWGRRISIYSYVQHMYILTQIMANWLYRVLKLQGCSANKCCQNNSVSRMSESQSAQIKEMGLYIQKMWGKWAGQPRSGAKQELCQLSVDWEWKHGMIS